MAQREEFELVLKGNFNKEVEEAIKNIEVIRKKTQKATSSFDDMAAAASGAIAALGIGALAKDAFQLAAGFEQTQVAFSTFLGDAGKANKLLGELDEFANVTPFDNESIIGASKSLLAASIPAEEMTNKLQMIGDLASGAQVPITELATMYAKFVNLGKLQADELNQLSRVNIIPVLADLLNTDKAGVFKLASQGKVTTDIFEQAMKRMTSDGGQFFQMMEKQSQTTIGRISTLQGKMQIMGRTIGQMLVPPVTALVNALIPAVDWLNQNQAILEVIIPTLGVLIGGIGTMIAVTKGWAIAQTLLNVAMSLNPIGLVVVGIAALTTALVTAWNKSEAFRSTILGLWEASKRVFTNIGNLFKKIFEPMFKAIDAFKRGDIAEAALQAGKGLFNLTPAGIIAEAIKNKDELTSGIADAFQVGSEKGIKSFQESQEAASGGALGALSPTGPLATAKTTTEALNTKSTLANSSVTSKGPSVLNINIESLVQGGVNISTETIGEALEDAERAVTEVLLRAVNNVSKTTQ